MENTGRGARRGRGHGRGGGGLRDFGRNRGRGRGGRGGAGGPADDAMDLNSAVSERTPGQAQVGIQPAALKPPPTDPDSGGGGTPGNRPTGDASIVEDAGSVVADGLGEDDVEAEVCFICASPVVHQSLAPCNHRTCHICSLRMRALYKSRACPHCRVSTFA